MSMEEFYGSLDSRHGLRLAAYSACEGRPQVNAALPPLEQLQNAISALSCAIDSKKMKYAAEAFLMLQILERQLRIADGGLALGCTAIYADVPNVAGWFGSRETVPFVHAIERLRAVEGVQYATEPIMARFGIWVVTNPSIDCLAVPYWIDRDRIDEPDWLEHISAKTWCPKDESLRLAIEFARRFYHLPKGKNG